jgi:moderate conductance mechanosensitive channel
MRFRFLAVAASIAVVIALIMPKATGQLNVLSTLQASSNAQTDFLIRQGLIAVGIAVSVIFISLGLYYWQRRLKSRVLELTTDTPNEAPTSPQSEQQIQNFTEVKLKLLTVAIAGVWGGGIVTILGLFPQTQTLQATIIKAAQIPLTLILIALGTYIVINLTYASIERFTSAIGRSGNLLTPENSQRLHIRVSTISAVTKSLITIILIGFSVILALISLGINVVPLLAVVSVASVGISLASQNIIKDVINGFLIILEDQYALGDMIALNNVGGLVETLNLRITQVRDAEGRLITIPNSEVKIVANLSSRWSRADLSIPLAYETDINHALKLIETVANGMTHEPAWQSRILESPQVLGVENFGEHGLIIRVWIKTQPLKQWEVAREFRRRLKIAFDEVGISIPIPQQTILLNDFQTLNNKQ